MKEYYEGKGCKCYARSENECGCNADWTDPKVYELEKQLDQANGYLTVLSDSICDNPDASLIEMLLRLDKSVKLIQAQGEYCRQKNEKCNALEKQLAEVKRNYNELFDDSTEREVNFKRKLAESVPKKKLEEILSINPASGFPSPRDSIIRKIKKLLTPPAKEDE